MVKGDTPAKNKINQDQFEQLCSMWCTKVEIAEFFGVSEDTLESWCKEHYDNEPFSVIFKRKCSKGKISLRRWQLKSAEKGNVVMQIWLGKQHLDQIDKIETKHEIDNGVLADLTEALSNAKNNR